MKIRLLAGLVLFFGLTACSGGESNSIVGPGDDPTPTDPEPQPEESVPTSMELSSPQDTINLGTDTVKLNVVVRDQNGDRMNLDELDIRYEVEDEGVLTVLRGPRVIAEPDTVFFSGNHPEGVYMPTQERGTKPTSKGPIPTRIEATVEGEDVSASVRLVQNSPVWWVNGTPDGSCMAVGYYTTGERVHTDITVWARDYTGRRIELEPSDVEWSVSNPDIIDYRVHADDFRTVKVWGLKDGKATMNVTVSGLTDKSEILSSEETDEYGNVSCSHL